MDLMFTLATVDTMQDNRRTRQLYEGWTGREPAPARYRAIVARVLRALATRLDPSTSLHPVATATLTA